MSIPTFRENPLLFFRGTADEMMQRCPFIMGSLLTNHLPAQVATHSNLAGQANRFSLRLRAIIMYPAIMFGVILLWHVLWRAYPKKRNYQAFWPTYR
jgi:Protein of unknown function (DUF1648)